MRENWRVAVRRLVVPAAILSAASIASATPTDAPTGGHVTSIYAGWNDAYMTVSLDSAPYNPEGCPQSGGYFLDAALPGNQLFSSLIITAAVSHQRLRFTVDGCAYNVPKIIGVNLLP